MSLNVDELTFHRPKNSILGTTNFCSPQTRSCGEGGEDKFVEPRQLLANLPSFAVN